MWASDIVDYLAAAGVGTAGEDLFWGSLPDKPESCGAVIPYPGQPPEQQYGSEGAWLEKPRAQFSWRAESTDKVAEAYAKAQVAFDALTGVQSTNIGTTKVYRVVVNSSPSTLYQDEDGLPVVGFSFVVEFETA